MFVTFHGDENAMKSVLIKAILQRNLRIAEKEQLIRIIVLTLSYCCLIIANECPNYMDDLFQLSQLSVIVKRNCPNSILMRMRVVYI